MLSSHNTKSMQYNSLQYVNSNSSHRNVFSNFINHFILILAVVSVDTWLTVPGDTCRTRAALRIIPCVVSQQRVAFDYHTPSCDGLWQLADTDDVMTTASGRAPGGKTKKHKYSTCCRRSPHTPSAYRNGSLIITSCRHRSAVAFRLSFQFLRLLLQRVHHWLVDSLTIVLFVDCSRQG